MRATAEQLVRAMSSRIRISSCLSSVIGISPRSRFPVFLPSFEAFFVPRYLAVGLAARSALPPSPTRRDTARAMSQQNVETITRLYDEFLGRPDRAFDPAVLQFFDPAVEVRQTASVLGTEGTFHGYDGMARSAREVLEVFREAQWVPVRLVDSGDHVVATVEFRAYGKHSGVEVKERIAHVWALRGGRIVAWHVYMDPVEALAAVGLSEQDAHADS